jgi:hypothetical protein
MSTTLQIFVRNTSLTRDNNFPYIYFDSDDDVHSFVTQLQSTPRISDKTSPYFVINNPHLLPDSIRRKHMYIRKKNDSDTESDCEDDIFDGIFEIYENIDELRKYKINNNTLSDTGFVEYLRKFEK